MYMLQVGLLIERVGSRAFSVRLGLIQLKIRHLNTQAQTRLELEIDS